MPSRGSGRDDLQTHEGIVAAAHNIVIHHLEQEISSASVVRMSEMIFEQTERVMEQIRQQRQPEIACKKGCFWCCCAYVEVTTLEALQLAEYIRAHWNEEQIVALKGRIADVLERRTGRTPDEQEARHIYVFCPLLVDGGCSIYPARPLTCRGWTSRDAEVCRTTVEETDVPAPPVPFYRLYKEITDSVVIGIHNGLDQTPLQNDRLELVAALQIALEDPDIVDRWLTGETVFPDSALSRHAR